MNIDPGKLDKRIKIQRAVRSFNANGYHTESWETVAETWAQFSRESGKERAERNADLAELRGRFLIRHLPGLSRKMTVLYRGERWEIDYLNDYGDRHEFIEILVRRLMQEG